MNNPQFPSSAAVARFLRNDGWKRVSVRNPRLLGFRSPEAIKDDFGKSIFLTIPSCPGTYDESISVSTVLDLLSDIKQTTKERMIFLINNLSSDIFDQRIFGVENLKGLPMEIIPDVMKCLKDLIYYSACATADASDDIIGSRTIGKEYVEKCRFVQTFPGSFGMRLEMPLSPNCSTDTPNGASDIPFGRRVMKRIYDGLNFAIRGWNEGDFGIITQNVQTGFNANLCETMANLTKILPDYTLGYKFAWSNEYYIEPAYTQLEEIRIPSKQYNELFASAAKSMRAAYESRHITISGEIIGLNYMRGNDDSLSMNKPYITIRWKQNYRKINVRIPLNQNDYRQACDAHRDGKMVSVTGILEKSKKLFILTNQSEFHILP